MSIEIVAIGNEVLRGMVVNTNSAFLGLRICEEGWSVVRQTGLPDETDLLIEGLEEALHRSSTVIATGGLGPTLDDNSVFCAEKIFKNKGEQIPNPVGSAPGKIFKDKKRVLILLPGVPEEMEAMFEKTVLSFLRLHLPSPQKIHREPLYFYLLRENDVDPLLRKLRKRFNLDIGIYPSYGALSVVIQGPVKKDVVAAKTAIAKKFAHAHLPVSKLEVAVHNWMQKKKKTLAFAESCTGGFMASQITALSGASDYFLGSMVVYSNKLKEKILGVKPATLKKYGAVSKEVVHEMWKGLLEKTGADYGIAVSGIAGPTGGTVKKPVGTVWYALGRKGKPPLIETFHFKGDRRAVILRTTRRLFALLWKYVNNDDHQLLHK